MNSSSRVGRARGSVNPSSRMKRRVGWSGTGSVGEGVNSSSRVGRVSGSVVPLSSNEIGVEDLRATEYESMMPLMSATAAIYIWQPLIT